MDEELVHLLKKASSEIKMLREQNKHMSTRLTMFDTVVNLINRRDPGGYGDMAGGFNTQAALDNYISKLESLAEKQTGTLKSVDRTQESRGIQSGPSAPKVL